MTSLTRAQVREVDRLAQVELGIPGMLLMENAGLGAAFCLVEHLGVPEGPVAIFCGGGNNAGDGYVVARQLANRGVTVRIYNTHPGDALRGDAGANRAIVDRMGLTQRAIGTPVELAAARGELSEAELLVDALLGTGFQGTVRPHLASVIELLNAARTDGARATVALDLPSGLDCDHGEPSNATVRADHTLTFFAAKRGFDQPRSREWTGEVTVVPIGAPQELAGRVRELPG